MANPKKIIIVSNQGIPIIYAVVTREADGYTLDNTGVFQSSFPSSFPLLTEDTNIKGKYTYLTSGTVWNDGTYTVVFYKQLSGVPQPATDLIVGYSSNPPMQIKNDLEVLMDVSLSTINSEVLAIPTNPLLTNDSRLNNLNAPISSGLLTSHFDSVIGILPHSTIGGDFSIIESSLSGIPTNPLLTTDSRLNNIDTTISSRLATTGYTAPDNASITAINNRLPASPANELTSQSIVTMVANIGFQGRITSTLNTDIQRPQSGVIPLLGSIFLKNLSGIISDPFNNEFAFQSFDSFGNIVGSGILFKDQNLTIPLDTAPSYLDNYNLAYRTGLGNYSVYIALNATLPLGNYYYKMEWFDTDPLISGAIKNIEVHPINFVDYSTLTDIKNDTFQIRSKSQHLQFDAFDNIQSRINDKGILTDYSTSGQVANIPINPLLTNDVRLNNLDVTISSRFPTSGYIAPDNSTISTINQKSDSISGMISNIPTNSLLTTDTRLNNLDITISSRLPTSSYVVPDNATISLISQKEDLLSGMISNIPVNPLLTTDSRLNNIDTTISSRLSSLNYIVPNNSGIIAIKEQTDKLTFITPRVVATLNGEEVDITTSGIISISNEVKTTYDGF